MTLPPATPREGETVYDYDGVRAYQRRCDGPECDMGLVLSPARFCPVCGGSGFRIRWEGDTSGMVPRPGHEFA